MQFTGECRKLNQVYWGFAVIGLILGLLVSTQYRHIREINRSAVIQRAQQLTAQIEAAARKRARLQKEIDDLRRQIDEMATNPEVGRLRTALEESKVQAGLVSLTGPGIEVTLNDSTQSLKPGQDPNLRVLHDEDILQVVNELRAAGAEAVAINGERLLATSEVRCAGPTIVVNRTRRLAAPFVITAIGDPEALFAALKMPYGVLDVLHYYGIESSIKKDESVTVPAYSGATNFQYAHPVTEGADEEIPKVGTED